LTKELPIKMLIAPMASPFPSPSLGEGTKAVRQRQAVMGEKYFKADVGENVCEISILKLEGIPCAGK